jgi:two-component system C4-dicarboxylate transport sensor histidine kinase DctB
VGKGLGLGLSISYNIIKDFGGNLSVSDAKDGGAEFVIRLRISSESSIPEAAE